MPIIECTSNNSNMLVKQGTPLPEAKISYELKANKLSKKLFCFVGTNILVHNYITGHRDPAKHQYLTIHKDRKFRHKLTYGATTVVSGDTWLFAGDWGCDPKDIKHNVRRLKRMLQRYIRLMPKSKPFAIHKDFDDGCYLRVTKLVKQELEQVAEGIKVWEADRQEWFERESRHYTFHDLKTLATFVPKPNPFMERFERRQKEFEEEMKRHKEMGCPICANREYLESLGYLLPEETGAKDIDYRLSMNFAYHKEEDCWALNWLVLYNKFVLEHTPKCKKCKRPIQTSVIFGCSSWVERVKSGLCNEHDLNYQRRMASALLNTRVPKSQRRIKEMDSYSLGQNQTSLTTFFGEKT